MTCLTLVELIKPYDIALGHYRWFIYLREDFSSSEIAFCRRKHFNTVLENDSNKCPICQASVGSFREIIKYRHDEKLNV